MNGITESLPRVSMDPHARYGSAWRTTGNGPLLTNRRITKLALAGHYGKEAQLRANRKVIVARNGVVLRCGCGSAIGVRFLRWSYLPKAGHYCVKCAAVHKATHAKEQEQLRALREALRSGTLYE